MSRRVVVAERARSDLADIIAYTRPNWGAAQAGVYVRRIAAMIEALAEMPKAAAAFEHRGHKYLRKRVGSHAIFARLDGDTLLVVRILHQSMDYGHHMN